MKNKPKIGCCAVVFNEKKEILVIDCAKGRGPVLPGGKWEEGETFKETAVRELFEETGLKLPYDSLSLSFHGVNVDGYYCYVFKYLSKINFDITNNKIIFDFIDSRYNRLKSSKEGTPQWVETSKLKESKFWPFYELFMEF